jgi:hypothetical protein
VIQRLVEALSALAADAETQASRHAAWTCVPDRLLPELSDALLLTESCQQHEAGAEALDAIRRLEDYLERECASAAFWTKTALTTDPRWIEVRRVASRALRALGRSGDSS